MPAAGAAAVVLMSVLTWLVSEEKIDSFYLEIIYPLVVAFSIAVMSCVKAWFGRREVGPRLERHIVSLESFRSRHIWYTCYG